MPSSPKDYQSAGLPPVEDNKLEPLASGDRLLRASAALGVKNRASGGKVVADDKTDALRRVLEEEWNMIPLDGRTALVDRLVSALLEDDNPLVKEIAAAALATQGQDGLTTLLNHPDSSVRSNVAISVGLLNPGLFPPLIEVLTLMDRTPDSKMLVDQVFAAVRDRRQREWPEANKPRPV